MNKTDLTDVSFLIPVRIDSKERLENLHEVLLFLKTYFDTTIIVLEADKTEQVFHELIDKKIFIEDKAPVFYRTKYLNIMTTSQCETPYVAIWDTDVLIEASQIIKATEKLRKSECDFVFPYDGRFLNVPSFLRDLFLKNKNIALLNYKKDDLGLAYGYASVGGAFIVNKKAYIKAGMENENFYGWGPEDAERVKRWEILGYNIGRVNGVLFHLYHPRNSNSWFGSKELEISNRGEFLKVCKMNRTELWEYIHK